jgi:tagatose-1,6-bisphosphate aldolase non-catalytic subunit AgaZ/GatZ
VARGKTDQTSAKTTAALVTLVDQHIAIERVGGRRVSLREHMFAAAEAADDAIAGFEWFLHRRYQSPRL